MKISLKKIARTTVYSALLFGAGSTAVMAQSATYDPNWYVAPSASYLKSDSGFGDNNGAGVGIRFGKALSSNWDVQLGTTYARTRENNVRYQQNTLGADALYVFSRKSLRPFVLVGAGYQEDRLATPLSDSSGYAPYLDAGVGLQLSLNDQWSLQADYRRVHGFLHDNDFSTNRSNNDYVTLGVNYSFGRGAAH